MKTTMNEDTQEEAMREMMMEFAMSDIGLTEDEAAAAVEDFTSLMN